MPSSFEKEDAARAFADTHIVEAPVGCIGRDPGDQGTTLQALFENTTVGMVEIDAATGRFLRVNRRYCQITGRSADELLGGLRVGDVLYPGEERVAISIAETRGDAERRYLLPDGRVAWVSISAAVTLRDAGGDPLRISAVVQDVTESHVAREKLRASEALLRLSLEVGQIGGFSRDLVTGGIWCGPETRAMHGFAPGEDPVPSETWLAAILPEDRHALLAVTQAAIADRLPEVGYEYRFRHPVTGEIRHIEIRTRYEYDQDGRPLRSMGASIDVTARRETEARITHLAFHDILTGLPNRVLFRQKLEAAIEQARRGGDVAVLYLDLDRFKDVNDTHGHSVGDALLCEVAVRLEACVDSTTSVARLGGDEFAVIQRGHGQPAGAAALAARLIGAFVPCFTIDGHQLDTGASIGVAIVPRDGLDVERVLKAADLALYGAKAEGRGRFLFFEPAMSARVQLRRSLELDLRHALTRGEFELFYQPILDVGTLAPCSMEALLRWRHPERGLVLPDGFIPLAEELGLIVPIGEWVLARACAEAATWPADVRVAVNLSAVQFGSRDLVAAVASAVRRARLDPGRLELEVTETVVLRDTDANLATLGRLKGSGARIALDDFGTGYSSLSYLRSFPFDKVKIDRRFTGDLGRSRHGDIIMRTVLDLCAGLGMTSTAEGVEREEQLQALADNGCREAQGYLFSRPVPALQVGCLLGKPILLPACFQEAQPPSD